MERGDTDIVQRIVDTEARMKGYVTNNEYRMSLEAPSRGDINFAELMIFT